MEKPLSIVGLDPGTTAAYAVLDLNSHLLQTYSAKELSLSQIISQIIQLSQPLVAATDKERPPSLVQEFSAKLGTLLLSPEQDLRREEKENLLQLRADNQHHNQHQQDSLAAALYAYKKLQPTLIKINRFIGENKLEELRNPFTKLILKENLSFEIARRLLTQPEEEKVVKKILAEETFNKKDFLRLSEKLDQAKKEKTLLENNFCSLNKNLRHLRQTNLFLSKKLSQSSQQIETLLQFKEKRIKDLSQALEKKEGEKELLLKKIKELKGLFFKLENKVVIRKVKDLGTSFSKKVEVKEGDYLFVENPSIVSGKIQQELKEKGVRLFSRIKKRGFFFLEEFLEEDDFVAVDKYSLEKALGERDILGEVMEEYDKNRRHSTG